MSLNDDNTYGAMSDSGIAAVVEAMFTRGEPYRVSFSLEDFPRLMEALQAVYYFDDGALSEWASNFASAIAAEFGIEFV